ncbi:hypothetical protein NDU88_006955 [Pleurodeles waltl]|uniref:Uncharacterized protein n=1 Tax=Pleurodeles waltl TaxID=8319 RepID=A0AAV7TZW0_PLEWA|nr:hypothetical protein NDU88_006955 [Pleurodeles waltl]
MVGYRQRPSRGLTSSSPLPGPAPPRGHSLLGFFRQLPRVAPRLQRAGRPQIWRGPGDSPAHGNKTPAPSFQDNEESFHLVTEESPSFHTGEMVYNSLSIINQNESYSVGPSSCLNEICVRLQAEVKALQAENKHLKAQLQGTCNSELAVQHLQAALSAFTSSRNSPYTGTSKICSRTFTVQKTDIQQLVKDSNDPSRFRNVLVPKRELHKVLEEAKAARDSAGFLLNGVSEILFSPKELASAKGITKARAGEAALDEEKVDALFSKIL